MHQKQSVLEVTFYTKIATTLASITRSIHYEIGEKSRRIVQHLEQAYKHFTDTLSFTQTILKKLLNASARLGEDKDPASTVDDETGLIFPHNSETSLEQPQIGSAKLLREATTDVVDVTENGWPVCKSAGSDSARFLMPHYPEPKEYIAVRVDADSVKNQASVPAITVSASIDIRSSLRVFI